MAADPSRDYTWPTGGIRSKELMDLIEFEKKWRQNAWNAHIESIRAEIQKRNQNATTSC